MRILLIAEISHDVFLMEIRVVGALMLVART
jgi:hypothetical protein